MQLKGGAEISNYLASPILFSPNNDLPFFLTVVFGTDTTVGTQNPKTTQNIGKQK